MSDILEDQLTWAIHKDPLEPGHKKYVLNRDGDSCFYIRDDLLGCKLVIRPTNNEITLSLSNVQEILRHMEGFSKGYAERTQRQRENVYRAAREWGLEEAAKGGNK